jgi:hypothetical protein
MSKPSQGKTRPAKLARRNADVVLAQVVSPEPEPVWEPEPEPEPVWEPEPEPEPVWEPEPESTPEQQPPAGVVSAPHSSGPYLQLYTEHIRVQDENVRLRRKVIRLEEDLKQWRSKKATKRAKLEGEELTNAIVDILLRSNLNIESLPDEVEREIYSFIINQISASSGAVSCVRKLFFCA